MSREARLLQDVHVDDKLTPQESGQLSDLIAEFSDVFALDQCELRCGHSCHRHWG